MERYVDYSIEETEKILAIDSPTGYTEIGRAHV